MPDPLPPPPAVPPPPRQLTPAETLVRTCSTWLPGLTAQGDRLAVPLMGPSGTLSLSVDLRQPSPFILYCGDAVVVAAMRTLGQDGEQVLEAYNCDWSSESEEVQSDFGRHLSDVPARLAQLRDALLALLWTADAYNADPLLPAESSTERDLQLSRIADDVASDLYRAIHYLEGGHGLGASWEKCPEWLKRELRTKAERSIRMADAIREGHARRLSRLWLQSWLKEAFRMAWVTDDHKELELIVRAALNRIESVMQSLDPAGQMFDLYERVLTEGPEAAFVKPYRPIRVPMGGAR